jgi:hypothetical protein
MRTNELADQLRERQLARGLSNTILREMDAEDMIWSYLRCPYCEERYVDNFVSLVQTVRSGEDFKFACDRLVAIHQIEAHGKELKRLPGGRAPLNEADLRKHGKPITPDELRDEIVEQIGWEPPRQHKTLREPSCGTMTERCGDSGNGLFACIASFGSEERLEYMTVAFQTGGVKSGGKVVHASIKYAMDYHSPDELVRDVMDEVKAMGAEEIRRIDGLFPPETPPSFRVID